MTVVVAPLIAFVATAWVALLVLAPYCPLPLAGFLYVFGSVICHQIPERSFHVDAAQLPVCARCFGLYLGAAWGACAAPAMTYAARRLTVPELRAIVLAATAPTVFAVLLEWTGVHSSNVARAAAGAMFGAVLTAFVLHYVRCERTRRSEFPARRSCEAAKAVSQPAPHI